ncbi:acetyltransferase [Lapillicoccus sp.]|uniref:acetyltransferase n=1 Tax=Lapillicoccus sp. TaxID=1909287 RepID=UPI003265B2C3
MSSPIVIVGCGGFGREVHDVVEAINAADPFDDRWQLLGYVDDSPTDTNSALVVHRGSRVLGGVGWFDSASPDTRFVIGIGTGAVRRAIDARLTAAGFDAAVLVHPAASLGADTRLAAGTVVCAGVRVTTNVTVGRHTHLNLNSTVGHDTTIGDYVTINPIAAISGNVTLEDEVMMGTHSAVLQGLRIGARSIVGAGACVVKDVPADVTVKGVPAR